jgi:hypothetical protein
VKEVAETAQLLGQSVSILRYENVCISNNPTDQNTCARMADGLDCRMAHLCTPLRPTASSAKGAAILSQQLLRLTPGGRSCRDAGLGLKQNSSRRAKAKRWSRAGSFVLICAGIVLMAYGLSEDSEVPPILQAEKAKPKTQTWISPGRRLRPRNLLNSDLCCLSGHPRATVQTLRSRWPCVQNP